MPSSFQSLGGDLLIQIFTPLNFDIQRPFEIRSLSHAALACKAMSGPALKLRWRRINSLTDLVVVLPMFGVVDSVVHYYPDRQQDWRRFHEIRTYVRDYVGAGYSGTRNSPVPGMDELVYSAVESNIAKGDFLFPNLRSVSFDTHRREVPLYFQKLSLLLSNRLRSVAICHSSRSHVFDFNQRFFGHYMHSIAANYSSINSLRLFHIPAPVEYVTLFENLTELIIDSDECPILILSVNQVMKTLQRLALSSNSTLDSINLLGTYREFSSLVELDLNFDSSDALLTFMHCLRFPALLRLSLACVHWEMGWVDEMSSLLRGATYSLQTLALRAPFFGQPDVDDPYSEDDWNIIPLFELQPSLREVHISGFFMLKLPEEVVYNFVKYNPSVRKIFLYPFTPIVYKDVLRLLPQVDSLGLHLELDDLPSITDYTAQSTSYHPSRYLRLYGSTWDDRVDEAFIDAMVNFVHYKFPYAQDFRYGVEGWEELREWRGRFYPLTFWIDREALVIETKLARVRSCCSHCQL